MEIKIRTHETYEVIDLSSYVGDAVRAASVEEGLCCVYVPHATAAIVINENADPNIGDDLLDVLNRLIPEGVWRHDKIDGNGAAHLKASILGPSETIPIRRGRLALGTWQAIMLVELDGPRDRRVLVNIQS